MIITIMIYRQAETATLRASLAAGNRSTLGCLCLYYHHFSIIQRFIIIQWFIMIMINIMLVTVTSLQYQQLIFRNHWYICKQHLLDRGRHAEWTFIRHRGAFHLLVFMLNGGYFSWIWIMHTSYECWKKHGNFGVFAKSEASKRSLYQNLIRADPTKE